MAVAWTALSKQVPPKYVIDVDGHIITHPSSLHALWVRAGGDSYTNGLEPLPSVKADQKASEIALYLPHIQILDYILT